MRARRGGGRGWWYLPAPPPLCRPWALSAAGAVRGPPRTEQRPGQERLFPSTSGVPRLAAWGEGRSPGCAAALGRASPSRSAGRREGALVSVVLVRASPPQAKPAHGVGGCPAPPTVANSCKLPPCPLALCSGQPQRRPPHWRGPPLGLPWLSRHPRLAEGPGAVSLADPSFNFSVSCSPSLTTPTPQSPSSRGPSRVSPGRPVRAPSSRCVRAVARGLAPVLVGQESAWPQWGSQRGRKMDLFCKGCWLFGSGGLL